MKKFLLVSYVLMSSLILKAQTFTSEQINIWKPTPSITIKDDQGKALFSVPCRFEKNAMLKATVKTLVVGDKNYLIKKEKKGIQHVYTGNWELVATMGKRGESIVFVKNNTRFLLQEDEIWRRPLERIYLNNKWAKAVYATIKYKIFVVELSMEKDEQSDLLMALSLHQLMEEEARKASENVIPNY